MGAAVTREPNWYTVVVDVVQDGEWKHLDPPTTQASEHDPQDLAAHTVMSYDLEERPGQWQVRVYEGYNRFDHLLATRRDSDT
jgi:hypothetical protein